MKIKITTTVLLFVQLTAFACNVPVFRYALEHWPVAPYRAVILKNSELSKAEQAVYEDLKKVSDGDKGSLNLVLWLPKGEDIKGSKLAEVFPAKLPADATVHLMYPSAAGVDKPFWSGKLTKENAVKIRHSSFRDKLAAKILEGVSGVFILMESADKKIDDKIVKEIDGYVGKALKTIELPAGIVGADGSIIGAQATIGAQAENFESIDQLRSRIPLKLAFEILRYDRESDEVMTALLMGLAPEHAESVARKPLVFAVYGRGRALSPMVNEAINMDNVRSIALFFTGVCACQVKALNPGTDLLLDHDWDRSVFSAEY